MYSENTVLKIIAKGQNSTKYGPDRQSKIAMLIVNIGWHIGMLFIIFNIITSALIIYKMRDGK